MVRRSGALVVASAAGLSAGVGLIPLEARADGSGEAVRFEYEAPRTCPSVDSFEAEVRARTARVSLAREGDKARTFQVKLAWSEAGAQGTLVVTDRDERTSRRVVDGDSCSAVVSALALVAALAIDPNASTGPLPQPAGGGTVAPIPAPTPPPNPLPSPPPPLPPTIPPAKPPSASSEPRRTGPPLDLAGHIALSILGAGDTLGPVFGPFVAGSVTVGQGPVVAPEIRLGFAYAGTDSPTNSLNEYAKFSWWRGELEVCPVRWMLARSVSLRPCALGRFGALVSAGHAVTSSLTSVRPWGELGVSVLLEWRVMGPLAIEGEVGPDFPLVRETFEFDSPLKQGYQAPSVLFEGQVGLGVHFP